MKKTKFISALIATASIAFNTLTPAHAAKIIMNGYTDSEALGVTVLIAKTGTDLTKPQASDIFWIDQQNIADDGSFSIALPAFDASAYTLHTNANPYTFGEAKTKSVFVSSTGLDTNSGETADAPTSLSSAIKNIDFIKEITLLDSVTYSDASLPGDVVIKGNSKDVVLTLGSKAKLTGPLKLDNLTLATQSTFFACGYNFEVTDSVTSTARLIVYGGADGETVENTNITLNGGLYSRIYGGSKGAFVTGNTNVTVGGNVNAGDGINDQDSTTLSPCYIFGGGDNGAVNGKTNITFTGNAVSRYLVGAGVGSNGAAFDTNINISGNSKVMNVYAGAASGGPTLSGCDTHINMSGGTAEALFGGSENLSMTGNTYLNLTGGQVTRRVYTGCYNNVDIGTNGATWSSNHYVNGTTTLSLSSNMKLNTKDGLHEENSVNVGVFAGSRIDSAQFSEISEVNTIIYLDDSYNSLSSTIGEKSSKTVVFVPIYLSTWLKSNEKYIVKSGTGGKVLGTSTGGTVKLMPNDGKYAKVNSSDTPYFANETAALSEGTNTVTFGDSFTASRTDTGMSTNAIVSNEGVLVSAVYDSQDRLVASSHADYVTETDSYNINVNCELKSGQTYKVRFFMLDSFTGMKPLMNVYTITVQ